MKIEKRWKLAQVFPKNFAKKLPNFHPVIIQLFYNRNLNLPAGRQEIKNAITKFLEPDYKEGLYDPYLIRDMGRAVDRIFCAIQKKEKIVIYGDYDADGITSSALLYKTLKFLGAKRLNTYIPHRQREGYGLNEKIVQKFGKEKIDLIITVDCGISNIKQVLLARKLGIDVIVSDHHQIPKKLPAAYAILNVRQKKDKYPFKELAGVGIAFKLAQALLQKDKKKPALLKEAFEKWLLDLVAIGTVADLCPILGENRVLVKYGLIILNQSQNIGLKKLFELARLKPKISPLNTHSIGFQIAPRLNAAGRLLHANTAFKLVLTESEREAEKLARELETTNQERQKLTRGVLQEAEAQIGKTEGKKVLLASHPSWSSGIAGLVAGRICDQYGKPCLIIKRGKKESVGSARSIESFDISKALGLCEKMLLRYGGHKTAAGFTLETSKISLFYQKLEKIAREKIKPEELRPSLDIDANLDLNEINWKIFGQIERFQPFGEGNPVPRFLASKAPLLQVRGVGVENKHLKLKLRDKNGKILDAIGFNLGDWIYKLIPGDKMDVVYELLSDEWNGNRKLQLKVVDLRISE